MSETNRTNKPQVTKIDHSRDTWQFWIDVGGTFTDCLAIDPLGEQHQTKVLSSGLFKGRASFDAAEPDCLVVETGAGERFWVGAILRILDLDGNARHESKVTAYDSTTGRAKLDSDPPGMGTTTPANMGSFELDHGIPAPILAIRRILQLDPSITLPPCQVHLGTTRGTNALLTRSGARTGFVTTRGFGDLLLIGDQARPHLFELTIRKPKPLFETAVEIDERILADGTVEVAPSMPAVREKLLALKSSGIESVAICLIHGFRFPHHEQLVGKIARELGFNDVRLSSDVAPLIKILARGETTVLDAYLNPVLGDYLDQIQRLLPPESNLQLMTSAGGLIDRDQFSGKDSVLSGPAGGIVGAARVAEQAGFGRALTFDMGGTSSDVGRYDGEIELEFETRKSDVRIMTPMVAIETVAAGGGSVCWFDGTKLMVGPQSAASDPGPACYGRGGPLAVTDINLFLGRIVKNRFPFPLDERAVEQRIQEICDDMLQAGFRMTLRELAHGFLAIANQNMASAIRSVSIARGYDPKAYLLVAFGGAGPQHCCAVADSIGIEKILDHPNGSILSAVGIRLADQTASRARSVLSPLNLSSMSDVARRWCEMEAEIKDQLGTQELQFTRSLDLRYAGTEACQTIHAASEDVSLKSVAEFETSFSTAHQRLFGFITERELEIVAARVEGRRAGNRLAPTQEIDKRSFPTANRQQPVWRWVDDQKGLDDPLTNVFDREDLQPGDRISGPALVAGELSTTAIDVGWEASMLADGQLLLQRVSSVPTAKQFNEMHGKSVGPDPVQLEIFNNHFSTIARQMGISLQMTSMSVNVKERLDFSCAIFTSAGDLVVNAPHIPVHLGAMSETVRAITRLNEKVSPGDVFVTNDPFAGGSHLPDVTVVTPVFSSTGTDLIFWVASRSHHSEIGGISPGSMPANATNLAQEGVLIRNFKLIDGRLGIERFQALQTLLTSPPYPSRSPLENVADIRAQVAANRTGQSDLLSLVDQYSQEVVLAYTDHIQAAAERKIRMAIAALNDGAYSFEDSMDNGATIRVAIEKRNDELTIDFAGTDPVLKGNLNANPAIVSSAVIYVLRCLIDEDIPLNEGVMKPVTVRLPECFLNPVSYDDPAQSPAVVGGNVETSQRIVDVLLGAMQQATPNGLAAASQGTMNNWLMGDSTFGYYETIGGGSGATPNGDGSDAVHTHMTNTRLTDPEVLESRYPVVLREFSIRAGSGGRGLHRGGDGMVRDVEFLNPLTVSLLTNRRTSGPYGIEGGEDGTPGVNQLIHADGRQESLPGSCEIQVKPGSRLRIETPGGGGVGTAKKDG